MRGKNKSTKRYLRKHRKNVIDPNTVSILTISHDYYHGLHLIQIAVRAKLEKQRSQRRKEIEIKKNGGVDPDAGKRKSALDRFKRSI